MEFFPTFQAICKAMGKCFKYIIKFSTLHAYTTLILLSPLQWKNKGSDNFAYERYKILSVKIVGPRKKLESNFHLEAKM
jgi:hypothetical protein